MHGRRLDGHRLRDLRIQAGYRGDEFAKAVVCRPGYLRNIEKGFDQPGAVLVHKFARALSKRLGRTVDIDEFTDKTDDATAGAA
jgi:transcriptional regulator with XRE-family HTH domain